MEALQAVLAEMQQVWEAVREKLLAHWIRHFPGTRPWIWWKLDAPEKHRRVLSGPGYSLLTDADEWAEARRLTDIRFGLASSFSVQDISGPPTVCESEYAYLKRLNLLTPFEEQISEGEFPKTHKDEDPTFRDDESWLPRNVMA